MEAPHRILRPRFFQIAAMLLLLLLVIFSARISGFWARNYIEEKFEDASSWVLQEQTVTRGFGLQLIDNQLRYAASFGLGLTDSMIRFENIPYDPKGIFISLWKEMNPGILVEKIEFLDHAVRITLKSSSSLALNQYENALIEEKYFSNVFLTKQNTIDGETEAVVVCLFA